MNEPVRSEIKELVSLGNGVGGVLIKSGNSRVETRKKIMSLMEHSKRKKMPEPVKPYTYPERFAIQHKHLLKTHVPSMKHIEVRLPKDITHIDASTINKLVRESGWKSSEIFPHDKPWLHVNVSGMRKTEDIPQ